MTKAPKGIARDNVIDYVDAKERFDGNMILFKRLALTFYGDRHVENLCLALEADDAQAAYQAAFGLKDVSGQLSFGRLYKVASKISDDLKNENINAAICTLPQLLYEHSLVLQALDSYQKV